VNNGLHFAAQHSPRHVEEDAVRDRMRGIRGLLLDVDGTLLVNDEPVPGAGDFIAELRRRGLAFRVTTNTTRRPRRETAEVLQRGGIEVRPGEILGPAALARRRIIESGSLRAGLLVPPSAREDLSGVIEDEAKPDWVVVGDIGAGFTFQRLNQAFRWLLGGAKLLALHRNRCWLAGPEGLVLDAGAFVAALEYGADVTAEVVGKPAPAFFELALADLGIPAAETLVVGDDPETDGAGRAAGCRVALVRTGKFAGTDDDARQAGAEIVADSVAQLL
jgi:HAD superfamily hydrolase (TIGR01458 family)